ncbi:MAG TPA: SLC13 family permease [Vicinamibacteria bacterium]|nr:SLC13 family permease [Vicinamibacteria bacterium]
MSPAVASLVALLVAIALSFSARVNVGIAALALAFGLGLGVPGLRADAVAAAFPSSLFVTLLGVTLLFAATESNGTLAHAAGQAVRLVRGNARPAPWLLFAVAFVVSALGPGAVPSVALIAPLGAAVARRMGIPPFIGALFVANGANAGNLSPLSAVGIVANSRMAEAGLVGEEAKVFAANALAHVLVSAAVYVFWRWRGAAPATAAAPGPAAVAPLDLRQGLSLAVVAAWAVGAVALQLPVGLSALAAAFLLLAFRAASEAETLRAVPWGALLMVSGTATLVALVEKTGGLDLFSGLLARLSTPQTVNGTMAFVTGLISTWSSTSGVVLPAFLPTVPGVLERLGGGDPLALSLSINVGSSLVDVSPLSTLGALCVAAVEDADAARTLFRRLLAWGLSMTLVGALLCQLLASPFARL